MLTAAEIVLKKKRKDETAVVENVLLNQDTDYHHAAVGVDLDEEIARLQSELAEHDRDSSSSDSDDSSSTTHEENETHLSRIRHLSSSSSFADIALQDPCRRNKIDPYRGSAASREASKNASNDIAVLRLSKLEDNDRIEALPSQLLPSSKKRVLAIDRRDCDAMKHSRQKESGTEPRISGLEAAVREVLGNYTPRSSEHLPFYCRVCAVQYNSMHEFVAHQSTEFHMKAVEMERKLSYCKVCRKQLTSPAQLKEHIKSRPHRERIQRLHSNQSGCRNQHHLGNKNTRLSRHPSPGRDKYSATNRRPASSHRDNR